MKKYTYTEKKDTRSGFGAGLQQLGQTNPNVVALFADLIVSLKMDDFKCQFKVGRFKCGCKTNLEVHHLSYKNLGNERFKELITLCHRHHEIIHSQQGKK